MALVRKYTNDLTVLNCQNWIDTGADAFLDALAADITQWSNIKTAARDFLDLTKGTVTGNKTETDEQTDVPLSELVITFDCCPLPDSIVQDIDYSEIDERNIEYVNALYALEILEYIEGINASNIEAGAPAYSPPLDIKFDTTYHSNALNQDFPIAKFTMSAMAGVSERTVDDVLIKKVLLPTKDLTGWLSTSTGVDWIENCGIKVKLGDSPWFAYPTDTPERIAEFTLPNPGEVLSIPASFRVSGMGINYPTELGGHVDAQNSASLYVTGGLEYDDGHTEETWNGMNYIFKPTFCSILTNIAESGSLWHSPIIIGGYQEMVSLYPNHPLFSRQNIYDIVDRTAEDEASSRNFINHYVNTIFEYREETKPFWHFMSAETYTYGDCEDFALTKAQMLIEAGWDVSRIKLEGGWEKEEIGSYAGTPTYGPGKGHMWLLIDDSIVMDISSGRTRESLLEQYNWGTIVQKNDTFDSVHADGPLCQWELVNLYTIPRWEGYPILEIEAFPHVKIDEKMLELSGEIERTK